MKKNILLAILCCLSICAVCLAVGINGPAYADGETVRNMSVKNITATCGSNTISDIYSDPVSFVDVASAGMLTDYEIRYAAVKADDAVLYTANYTKTTTGRTGANITEYVCKPTGIHYYVTEINTSGDGTTYIPVGGFVLSVANNSSFAQIGDEIVLGGESVKIPIRAVESASGSRIVVDNTNTTRSGPMVVYYDYQFGEKTGTNVFGTEMTCTYDFAENVFKVVSFRNFGQGDDSGSDIPENSFVLSAYGEGYRQLLVMGELFRLGDGVKMVGFDFIRFGGTVVGDFNLVNPTEITNADYCWEFPNQEFPAYRGTDQTMIYKDGWNYKDAPGTGTNVYGYEAAVDADGIVVELGVNVSKIPEGGFVVSGHGKGRDFIRSNMVLGATVVLDEEAKTYSISTTLNSYYENLVTSVESAISIAERRIEQLYDLDTDKLGTLIGQAREKLADLRSVKQDIEQGLENAGLTDEARLTLLMQYNSAQLEIVKLQHQIVVSSAESKAVSARAVWHRPVEMTYADLEANIRMYKDLGINLIFVETIYNGYAIYRSDLDLFPYTSKLANHYSAPNGASYNDYLSAFVALCDEYNIEVHAWVENFYVGAEDAYKKGEIPVLASHPEWVLYNDNGTIVQRNEGGKYIFLDPANTDVQDALIQVYDDMLARFPSIKGLNLDYIRYPVSGRDEDVGYTRAAMMEFYEQQGKTFTAAQLADDAAMRSQFKKLFDKAFYGASGSKKNYDAWVVYRAGIVTQYVSRIKTEIKEKYNITLSTAVFASVTESMESKKQDWKTWFANGWIDISTPMAYYTDPSDVLKNVETMILAAGNCCYYYAGLASSYSGLPAWQNKEQIEAAYLAGANGYVIFCSTQIVGHDDVQQALSSGVNRKQGVLPHASAAAVVKATFDDILDKAQRIYIPKTGMTNAQYRGLENKFNEIGALPCQTAEEINYVKVYIESLYKDGIAKYARGYSGQRITEQLRELVSLLDNKISIQMVVDKQWNPEINASRPALPSVTLPEPVELEEDKITLDKFSATLTVGGSTTISATPNVQGVTITWVSSNPDVATVDQDGRVTAVGEGTAFIKASFGDAEASFRVTVVEAPSSNDPGSDPSQSGGESSDSSDGESGNKLKAWQIAVICVGAAAVAAGVSVTVVLVTLKKRKSAQEQQTENIDD